MAVKDARRQMHVIRYRHEDDEVLFVGRDEDRFLMTVQEAIRACSIFGEHLAQIRDILSLFAAWLAGRQAAIRAGYLGFHEAGLRLLVVANAEQYNVHLADELCDLELAIADQYPEVPVQTLLLPNLPEETLQTFIPDHTLRLMQESQDGQPQ